MKRYIAIFIALFALNLGAQTLPFISLGLNDVEKSEVLEEVLFPVWAEENGALSNNNTQWSYGNGATGNIGVVIPVDAELVYLTFSAETAGTSVSIDIMRNGGVVDNQNFTGNHASNPTSVNFTAGQRIGFRTAVEVGAYIDARVCAWFKRK